MALQLKPSHRLPTARWVSYPIALLGAPLLTLIAATFSPPTMIPVEALALIPIMFSAYLGAVGPALLAIVVGALGIGLDHTHGNFSALLDAVVLRNLASRWSLFCFSGVLITFFTVAAHRARRRAEISELQASSTLANVDEAIIVTDREGCIQYLNPSAAALISANANELLNKRFGDVFPIYDRNALIDDEVPQPIHLPLSTQTRIDHYVLLDAAGRTVPLEVTIVPIREGGLYNGSTAITLRDCSERENTEHTLRERIALQERLEAIAGVLPGALHSLRSTADGHTALVYASPSFIDVCGLDPAPAYKDGHLLSTMVHPDDKSLLKAAIQKAAAELSTLRIVHRVLHPKKGLIWLELHSTPTKTSDGGLLWHGIFFDVTQRKLAEDSLKQSEARLLGIIDASMDSIVTWDDRLGIVVFNPAAEHMFRCAESGMLGLSLEKFITGYLQADSSLLINMLKRDEIRDLRLGELSNLYGRRSDGELFPLELSISRTEVEGRRLLTMTLRDITERKRAAERLHASQQQLRAALEAGAMGVMKLYTLQREVEFDEKAIQQIGVKCPPHSRQSLAVLFHMVHPEDRRRLMREYLRAINHRASFTTECRVVDAANNVRWLMFRGGVLIEDGTKEPQLTAIVTDATDRKLLEEQRLRSQKLESLGVLAGGIAHDFNNLLLAITGNVKLAMSEVEDPHPAAPSLREISKAATRATDLVRRILAFSRPQDHKREPVALVSVVDEVLGLARAVLPASITIRVFSMENSPMVLADATQVHQALINLLTNAADAVRTPGGEIEVHLDVVEADTRLCEGNDQLHPGERYARVTVSDNGQGMDAATLQRIFDPFYTTKPLGQGTGLGLAIVHGIMKSHDGAVTVYSEVGRGTSFALYFPVYAQATLPTNSPVMPKNSIKHGCVLYVDDEESLVFLMTRVLRRMGHQVTGFTAPEKAFEAFKQDPDAFDLIVSDMSMPGMSGLELARKILDVRPQLPVVITTGFVRAEDYQAAASVGVRQLILKPNTIDELGVTIERVLQGKKVDAQPSVTRSGS